jgi:hypothetical protein
MMATASPLYVSLPEFRFYPTTPIFAPSFMPHFAPLHTTPAAPAPLAKDGDDDQVCAMLLNLKNTFMKREFITAPLPARSISPVLSGEFSSDASSDRKRYRSGESDHEDVEFLPESKASRLHNVQISNSNPIAAMAANGQQQQQQGEKPKLRRKRNPNNIVNKDKQGAEIAHSHQARWMERFNELKTYREKYGNCNVTFAKEHETYKTLAYWVSNQRISYRKRNMPLDRIQMLRDIGFDFNQCGRETTSGAVSPTSFMSFSDSHSSESGSEGEAGMMNPYSPSMKSSKKEAPFANIVNQSNNKMMDVVVGDEADKQQNCRRKLFEQVQQL